MSEPSIRVDYDPQRLVLRFRSRKKAAQVFLDESVMKDTDEFVKFRSGTLARSVQTATTAGSGKVIYDTPYAHAAYESHARPNTEVHPNATRMWFEVSKKRYMKRWAEGVDRILKEGNGR